MSVKLLTEHVLEFLSLKGGCTSSSVSTLVKMSHCWKSQMIFHENSLLANDSHEITYLIFSKLGKIPQNLSSAADVIGALRVNHRASVSLRLLFRYIYY